MLVEDEELELDVEWWLRKTGRTGFHTFDWNDERRENRRQSREREPTTTLYGVQKTSEDNTTRAMNQKTNVYRETKSLTTDEGGVEVTKTRWDSSWEEGVWMVITKDQTGNQTRHIYARRNQEHRWRSLILTTQRSNRWSSHKRRRPMKFAERPHCSTKAYAIMLQRTPKNREIIAQSNSVADHL
jgi:hypothetical protein